MQQAYHLQWKGPFALAGSGAPLLLTARERHLKGLYLLTSEYRRGYLIYAAGWTTRPFAVRFREHILQYRRGTYTILDAASLRRGIRKEHWHGMWTKKATNTPEMRDRFKSLAGRLQPALEELLATFRIFLAPLEEERRVLARIEAAIMHILWSRPGPVGAIPDQGMALAPMRKNESPFTVLSPAPPKFHGLPTRFRA